MKVALVVHDLHDHGGHSLYTKILADELSHAHEVAVFANRCERPASADWKFHHVSAWRNSALALVQSFPFGLRAHTNELARYDIRHMQGYCGGEPNLVTAHICVAAYLSSLRSITRRDRASLRLMAAAEQRFYRRYEGRIIAVSRKIAEELREFYQVRGAINVIHHGVDTARFDKLHSEHQRSALRAELGFQPDQTVALYVGDLTKAHLHLKRLTEAAPQVEFIIVTGTTRYRWQLPNVRFFPPVTSLDPYYATADAFVFPTTYDAFGMVVLEAMASGLPVFSSDCAGAAELIESGKNGFVFPLNDWVEAAIGSLRQGDLLRPIGTEAKQTARQHGWAAVVRGVEQLYFQTAAKDLLPGETGLNGYRHQTWQQ